MSCTFEHSPEIRVSPSSDCDSGFTLDASSEIDKDDDDDDDESLGGRFQLVRFGWNIGNEFYEQVMMSHTGKYAPIVMLFKSPRSLSDRRVLRRRERRLSVDAPLGLTLGGDERHHARQTRLQVGAAGTRRYVYIGRTDESVSVKVCLQGLGSSRRSSRPTAGSTGE